MLIAISKYLKPLQEVDLHRAAHVAYLQKLVANNVLLVGGRQMPPTGAVLIAKISSKEAFLKLLKEDPYVKAGLAEYTVLEFTPGVYDPHFLSFLSGIV